MEETDIIELEKRYWVLKAQSKTGLFDLETFKPIMCPPVPEALCQGERRIHMTLNLTKVLFHELC